MGEGDQMEAKMI